MKKHRLSSLKKTFKIIISNFVANVRKMLEIRIELMKKLTCVHITTKQSSLFTITKHISFVFHCHMSNFFQHLRPHTYLRFQVKKRHIYKR